MSDGCDMPGFFLPGLERRGEFSLAWAGVAFLHPVIRGIYSLAALV